MARVQLIEKEQASPKAKELYEKIEKNGARILNLYKVLNQTEGTLTEKVIFCLMPLRV